jgi:rhodanese-related sulfurtransferase
MFYRTTIRALSVFFALVTPIISVQQLWQQFSLPAAPEITADQILSSAEQGEDSVVIVDVRAPAESNVSIIPTAITRETFERNIEQHRGKRVVLYCTIGVRSGAYASRLQKEGWDAWNYKGSILDWCDRGLPLLTPDQEPTKRVHTYAARFSAPVGYISVH